jgi:hypothetical protein
MKTTHQTKMDSDKIETYYMVQVEGKSAPNVKHLSQQDAKAEAERLGAKEQCRVDVLQCVATYYPPKRLRSTADMVDALLDTGGYNKVHKGELATRLLDLEQLVEMAYAVLNPTERFSEEEFQQEIDDTEAFLAEAERYIDVRNLL